MTEAGRRNRKVLMVPLTDGKGASGFPYDVPGEGIEVWASRTNESGGERYVQNQHSAPFECRWEVPYAAIWDPELIDVAKAWRLVYEGRTHDILRGERTGLQRDDVALFTLARQG